MSISSKASPDVYRYLKSVAYRGYKNRGSTHLRKFKPEIDDMDHGQGNKNQVVFPPNDGLDSWSQL